jgi:arylsulfatase A-like enzyme
MHQSSRRDFLRAAGTAAAALAANCSGPAPRKKPNIVLIIADDLGYADIGVHGCTDIPTPHIDSIARNGVRFTDAYAGASVCSPSRACMMTGRFPCTFGYMYNPLSAADTYGLPMSETTLGEVMRAAGYATGYIGKWHLGNQPQFRPTNRGFDEFFGFLDGPQGYGVPDPRNPDLRLGNKLIRNDTPIESRHYITDLFTDEACAFIDRHGDNPFYLVVAHQAPHIPLQATPSYLAPFASIAEQQRQLYAAVVHAMDVNVGRIIDVLKQRGLYEDTLIVFVSDNGGSSHELPVNNGPFRGEKAKLFEGGIRVPLLMQWPNGLPVALVFEGMVSLADLLPTFAASAEHTPITQQPLHGVNLLPYLQGPHAGVPHDKLLWGQGGDWAVRQGDWKLIENTEFHKTLLCNLEADPGETADLSNTYPEKLAALRAEVGAWRDSLPPPIWGWVERQVRQR